MDEDQFAIRYPHLFQGITWQWGPSRAHFILMDKAPWKDLIANVNLVPYIRSDQVMIHLGNGSRNFPSGTLEPEEDAIDCIHRELSEEVGELLISYQIIGAWSCYSMADRPCRPTCLILNNINFS